MSSVGYLSVDDLPEKWKQFAAVNADWYAEKKA